MKRKTTSHDARRRQQYAEAIKLRDVRAEAHVVPHHMNAGRDHCSRFGATRGQRCLSSDDTCALTGGPAR